MGTPKPSLDGKAISSIGVSRLVFNCTARSLKTVGTEESDFDIYITPKQINMDSLNLSENVSFY